jgi:tRNA uridine 5-carboxymethylaminomethyl modification enzyme
MGLASQERMEKVMKKTEEVDRLKLVFKETSLEPGEINEFFNERNSATISEKQKLEKILLRPNINILEMGRVEKVKNILQTFDYQSVEQAEIQVKYQVYLDKEKELVGRMKQLEELEIPEQFDYQKINSLGAEAREKLSKAKPKTLGQASRISGINPSDVQILMVFMGR